MAVSLPTICFISAIWSSTNFLQSIAASMQSLNCFLFWSYYWFTGGDYTGAGRSCQGRPWFYLKREKGKDIQRLYDKKAAYQVLGVRSAAKSHPSLREGRHPSPLAQNDKSGPSESF
jgi:hypothetical protein